MKVFILIAIVFSFVLVLSFVSYGQKTDSSSAQTKIESKFDSTIIRKRFLRKIKIGNDEARSNSYVFMMNEKIISKHEAGNRLSIFKSSELEYKKSRNLSLSSTITCISAYSIGTTELMWAALLDWQSWGETNNYYRNKANNATIIGVGCLFIGLPAGIIMSILKRRHLKKSIRLYNEEILKRHQ